MIARRIKAYWYRSSSYTCTCTCTRCHALFPYCCTSTSIWYVIVWNLVQRRIQEQQLDKEVLWQALPYWRIEGVAQSQRAAAPHHSLTLTASQAGSALSARRQSPAVPRPRRRARAPRPSASCRNYRQNISSYVPLWTLDIKLCRSVLYAERIEVSLQELGTR